MMSMRERILAYSQYGDTEMITLIVQLAEACDLATPELIDSLPEVQGVGMKIARKILVQVLTYWDAQIAGGATELNLMLTHLMGLILAQNFVECEDGDFLAARRKAIEEFRREVLSMPKEDFAVAIVGAVEHMPLPAQARDGNGFLPHEIFQADPDCMRGHDHQNQQCKCRWNPKFYQPQDAHHGQGQTEEGRAPAIAPGN